MPTSSAKLSTARAEFEPYPAQSSPLRRCTRLQPGPGGGVEVIAGDAGQASTCGVRPVQSTAAHTRELCILLVGGVVPRQSAGRAYLPRVWDDLVKSRLKAMGAVLIEGVKGCGKTATARQIASSEVLLDSDPDAVRAADLDPRLILDRDTPRLLDEWQRVPRLWDAVRRAVDDRGSPGQFILTGSATPRDDIPRHSGAGRFSLVRMRTMTLTEKQVTSPSVSVSRSCVPRRLSRHHHRT